MEIHSLLPSLIKAVKFASEDQDPQLQTILMEVYELLGRYLLPELYLYYILPRLRNDPDVVAFEMDNESRLTVMMFLQALLSGSKSSQIIPFFDELVTVLTDSFILNYLESAKLSLSILNILETLCEVTIKGKKQHVIESFYVTTGRLTSLQVTIRKLFKFLLTVSCLFSSELQVKAMKIMAILSSVESNSSSSALPSSTTMKHFELYRLFEGQSSFIYNDILDGEYALTKSIFEGGFTIDTLQLAYQGVDWRNELNHDCNSNRHPSRYNTYYNISMHPLETIFHKSTWKNEASIFLDVTTKYSEWASRPKSSMIPELNAG